MVCVAELRLDGPLEPDAHNHETHAECCMDCERDRV